VYCTPAKMPFSRDIILAERFFLGKRLLVISPFPISSAKKVASAFFARKCNLGYLKCVLALFSYS